jgi:hypothetical protein
MKGFESLSPNELDSLMEAPALITVLVGAADGQLDSEERNWAAKLTQAYTYGKKKQLIGPYYEEAGNQLIVRAQTLLSSLPQEVTTRNSEINSRLSALNQIMQKLDPVVGAALYRSFVGLAGETAKASGGFLRVGAVSAEESRWASLPMLMPILPPPGARSGDAWEEEGDEEA